LVLLPGSHGRNSTATLRQGDFGRKRFLRMSEVCLLLKRGVRVVQVAGSS